MTASQSGAQDQAGTASTRGSGPVGSAQQSVPTRAEGTGAGADRRQTPIDRRVWDADLPCPECENKSVIGFIYLDQHGHHQHTHYVCTFWKSPDDKSVYLTPGYDASKDRCGWHGWSVPGWDAPADASDAGSTRPFGPDSEPTSSAGAQ